ncbi:MAG: cell division protein FtsL [Beijerinckiaceae bacterium]
MLRLLNVFAVAGLIGTAMWAYSIKYDTIYYAEQVKKLEKRLDRERDAISVLRAEWQHINRPVRLQILADRHLQMQTLQQTQIAKASDLPAKPKVEDPLGDKLDQLLTGSTPAQPARGGARPAAIR